MHKRLRVTKRLRGEGHPAPSNKRSIGHAEDEDQERGCQALQSGSIKRAQAFKRHILTKKTTKVKRHLRGVLTVHDSDVKAVRAMLPNA